MLNLGVVKRDDKIINHRSLVKVCLNPLLRLFGFQIATSFDEKKQALGLPVVVRCPRRKLIWSWSYDITGCQLEKKRLWI
jgi:hypothetical protein